MNSCIFEFDNNPDAVFYPGQPVKGTATLHLQKSKYIRGIYISFTGGVDTGWSTRKYERSDGQPSNMKSFSATDDFLSLKTYLLGSKDSDSFEIQNGSHELTFTFTLPENSPGSFNGYYGNINYELELTVDRPIRNNYFFKYTITVIRNLDLDLIDRYKLPAITSEEKHYSCVCHKSGTWTVTLELPYSGYVPGQKIPYKILFQNDSTIDCNSVFLLFMKNIQYSADKNLEQCLNDEIQLHKKLFPGVKRYSNKEFSNFVIVPPVPASTLSIAEYIDIFYYFKILAWPTGCKFSGLELTLPVVIGTSPSQESLNNSSVMPAPDLNCRGNNQISTIVPDCYKIDETNQYNEKITFLPKYPIYTTF